jgi:hypothetical protein
MIYNVTTMAEFDAAKTAAIAGDVINLSSGIWEPLQLHNLNYGLGQQVTIKGDPGAIVRGMSLENLTGVLITSVDFDGNGADDIIRDTTASASGVNNFGVTRCTFVNSVVRFIYLHGGDGIDIQRNHFGVNSSSNAHIILEPTKVHPLIQNVVVKRNIHDDMTGNASKGIWVKCPISLAIPPPLNVVIAGNTYNTTGTGVGIDPQWVNRPLAEHPVVSSNAMREYVSYGAGRLTANVAEEGMAETGMVIGPLNLNPDLSPSASSTLLIDLADPLYAPIRDYYNNVRVGPPDIGAIEYLGG